MTKSSKNLLILLLLVIIGIFVYQYTVKSTPSISKTTNNEVKQEKNNGENEQNNAGNENQNNDNEASNDNNAPSDDNAPGNNADNANANNENGNNANNGNNNGNGNGNDNNGNNPNNGNANNENNANNDDNTPPYAQTPNRTPCNGLFPYGGNQGNSTFIDTTAAVYNFTNQTPEPVYNGYEIRGCVRQIAGTYDNWAPFEGVIGTWKIKDANGNVLVSGVLNAELTTNQPDLMAAVMAGDMIAFTENVTFDFTPYAGQQGTLELFNDNPSGETQNDRQVQIPITFQ